MAEIKFEIHKNLGVLNVNSKGWQKGVNIVSWNGRKPKLDIREWDENHEKMGKGLTFNREEALELKNILNEFDIDELSD